MPGRLTVTRLLAAAVLTAPLLVSSVRTDVPASAATECLNWGSGTINETSATFTQQLTMFYCASHIVYGRMHVHTEAGYEGSHVKSCAMHIALINERTGHHEDQVTDCTIKARVGGIWELTNVGWSLDRPGDSQLDPHHMTGWVNITTGVQTYDTYPYASSVAF